MVRPRIYTEAGQERKFISDCIGTQIRNITDNPMQDPEIRQSVSGRKSSNWKGGILIKRNRKFVYAEHHPNKNHKNYIQNSRLVMEKKIGRYLKQEEVVHHLDGDESNDDIENLYLFKNRTEHLIYHHKVRKIVGQYFGIKRNKGWHYKWQ